MAFKAKSVIKAIGDPRLELVAGKGYWYFVFNDIRKNNLFDTQSVMVMRLSDLSQERWIEEGKDFLAKMQQKIEEQMKIDGSKVSRLGNPLPAKPERKESK